MKIMRLLDQDETRALADLLNQMIVRELVLSDRSVGSLAKRLNTSPLKLWRRVRRLESLGLVEVRGTRRSGNIQTKLYRAAATSFIPRQFLDLRPKDARLLEALKIYSQIQREMREKVAEANEIPEGVDPLDYSFYVSMRALASFLQEPGTKERASALKRSLAGFKLPVEDTSG